MLAPTIVRMNAAEGNGDAGGDGLLDLGTPISYDGEGLVPCVVQDWSSGEVLTLAYMNEQALARTRDTGELHLWSRSRGEQWHKGETSGNVQSVAGAAGSTDDGERAARAGWAAAGLAVPHWRERKCFHLAAA